MKRVIKINFTDFWEGFSKKDNFFYNLLSSRYAVEISDTPDFLFYSCYGRKFLNYKCTRIFYASENMRPDFLRCDYAISFDYIKKKNHFRLPLYHLYIIDGKDYYEKLTREITRQEAATLWKQKTKFCCMLVSNPHAKERINFFNALSKVKHVDSGGRYLNNIGYAVEDKPAFISDYKFVLAFENSSYPGYTTEKILEPLVANCIPVYWGNPLIENDFNGGAFVNANNYLHNDALIKRLLEIDENEELAIEMLIQKKIPDNAKDHLKVKQEVLEFFSKIITTNKRLPVALNRPIQLLIMSKELVIKIVHKLFKKSNLRQYA